MQVKNSFCPNLLVSPHHPWCGGFTPKGAELTPNLRLFSVFDAFPLANKSLKKIILI
jgi:hypothetical protein